MSQKLLQGIGIRRYKWDRDVLEVVIGTPQAKFHGFVGVQAWRDADGYINNLDVYGRLLRGEISKLIEVVIDAAGEREA